MNKRDHEIKLAQKRADIGKRVFFTILLILLLITLMSACVEVADTGAVITHHADCINH